MNNRIASKTLAASVCSFLALAGILAPGRAGAQGPAPSAEAVAPVRQTTISVQVDKPGAKINPAMWGAFFEDINFGADGGLYAEEVKNRSFEFPEALMGWTVIHTNVSKGDVKAMAYEPAKEPNSHYLEIRSEANRPLGVSNEGFRGMGMTKGDAYDFSAQIRYAEGTPPVTIEIVGADGTTLASTRLEGIGKEWKKITATLKPNDTDPKSRMTVIVEGRGSVDLDMVSLFPEKTWKNRPGGLRADMVQALADLKPGFLRFPGGCVVEGSDLAKRYQWKNTIGPVEDRKLLINRWNTEFKHRPTPDYFQSYGLGFYEFFQLCEDIGAEPLPLLNCGMACQFNSAELCPIDQLGPYIQDALDLIEFANGPATSVWGAKRAAMGHPEPFHLKMMGVGNEQWGPQFIERLALFTKAIKAKYPDFMLVSDAGPSPEDDRFNFLWPELRKLGADIVDEHCYANPIWFLSNTTRYDNYDRNGPKVFFGEYAAQSVAIVSTKNRNNLECALAEGAYMTGLERNADVVRMASYAPLYANIDAWQWTPDMMWTNSLETVKTPNYYVQQLFSANRGDVVIPVSNTAPVKEILPAGRIGIGTSQASAEFKDVKVERDGKEIFASDFAKDASGWEGEGWKAADGVYRQEDARASATSFAGDKAWSDYTVSLKARKTGGAGGIVITVLDDGAGARAQWTLGGWGNKQHGIQTHYAEQDQVMERVPGTIEANRWHDVKIAVNGGKMECSLDGKLIQTAEVLRHRVPSLFTSATRDEATGETILKVVNPGDQPNVAKIHLEGAKLVGATAEATVLAGALADENSFENPAKIAPVKESVSGIGADFEYSFKPRSATVLRLKTGKE